jgi:anti-anti-sigma factor
MGDFDVVVVLEAQSVLVRPRGELDLATSDRLQTALDAVDASTPLIVLDLSGVSFLDASGLRVLIEAKRTLGERLTLLPGAPAVQRLFALTGTDAALGFAPGEDEDEVRAAAANMSYMRELWAAYRAGGAQALAERLPAPPAARSDRLVWGASELSDFWAHTVVPVPDPKANYRLQTVGSSVLVSADTPPRAGVPGVIWSLYVFQGRTFVRALSLNF